MRRCRPRASVDSNRQSEAEVNRASDGRNKFETHVIKFEGLSVRIGPVAPVSGVATGQHKHHGLARFHQRDQYYPESTVKINPLPD